MKKAVYIFLFIFVSLLRGHGSSLFASEARDTFFVSEALPVGGDTASAPLGATPGTMVRDFRPDPARATWYALVCPGLGQIYNRSYWKVPILYGGVATLSYLILWNGRMYNDYKNAYHDLMDTDPTTDSYAQLVPSSAAYGVEWMQGALKKRRDMYRRYRDLSIFGMAALYVVSVLDAFVDAHLYDFTVSDDLSLRVEPMVNPYGCGAVGTETAFCGFQCSVRF